MVIRRKNFILGLSVVLILTSYIYAVQAVPSDELKNVGRRAFIEFLEDPQSSALDAVEVKELINTVISLPKGIVEAQLPPSTEKIFEKAASQIQISPIRAGRNSEGNQQEKAPTADICKFTTAFWEKDKAVEGEDVKIIANGINCGGKEVKFEVKESDIFGEQNALSNPRSSFFEGSSTFTTWKAEKRGDILSNPEYFFVATSGNSAIISSNKLKVERKKCTESWKCQDWNECKNDRQSRSCTDSNRCNTGITKPIEFRECTMEIPVVKCNDECSPGQRECISDHAYRICGNFDNDGCLEWSPGFGCSNNYTCSFEKCIEPQTPKGPEQAPITCGDGTLNGECSSNKPLYCNNGNLVNAADECGCPPETFQSGNNCLIALKCSDGTLYEECSLNKPYYCNLDGDLIIAIDECGCSVGQIQAGYKCTLPDSQTPSGGSEKGVPPPTCSDGTISGQCSSNKPLYCNNGELSNSASECGCPSGLSITGENCVTKVKCLDSDSGLDYYTKGFIDGNFGKTPDRCMNVGDYLAKSLIEYTCLPDGTPKRNLYVCPNGCLDGACIELG